MAYVDLNTLHDPSSGSCPPATWGDQVRDNFQALHPVVANWDPIVNQSTANISKTTTRADYVQIGKLVIAWFQITITGSGVAGNAVQVLNPVTAANAAFMGVGSGLIGDLSVGQFYSVQWVMASTTIMQAIAGGETTYWGVDPSIGLASGDTLVGQIAYMAA